MKLSKIYSINWETFGYKKDLLLVLSSISLALLSVFYLFVTSLILAPTIYIFFRRVTYDTTFVLHIIDPTVDVFILISAAIVWFFLTVRKRSLKVSIIALLFIMLLLYFSNLKSVALLGTVSTLPLIILLLVLDRTANGKILVHDLRLSLRYITITGIVLASSGIMSLSFFVIAGIRTVTVENIPYGMYQELFSIFAPFIMAALIFCMPLKILLQYFNKIYNLGQSWLLNIDFFRFHNKRIATFLILCACTGILLALTPHSPFVNLKNERLGVDSPHYEKWIKDIQNQNNNQIYYVMKNSMDRPLSVLILFLVTEVTKINAIEVVEYIPVLLVPLLSLVTFFLTRELTMNDKVSVLAAFLSVISFQSLVGIYSAFYANWIALILGYFSLGMIVRYLRSPSYFKIVILAVAITAVLLAHVYTWTIIIAVTVVLLLVLYVVNYYKRKHILILILVLSSSIVVDIVKTSWFGSSTGLEVDFSVASHGLGVVQFGERLKTLADTVQIYYGGAYANMGILGLVVYWLIRCNTKEMANIFAVLFLSAALVPLFLGDWVLQSRVLYEIPFQIPAAISLYFLWKGNHKLIFIAAILISVYLSLHVLTNLGYIPLRELIR